MSALLFTPPKQPAEVRPYFYDYTGGLPDGESITAASVTVTEFLTGTDVTATVLSSSAVSSPRVNIVLMAGTTGTRYKVRYLMTTTSGYTMEGDVYYDVMAV